MVCHSCCQKQKFKKGLWSPEEDRKLRSYVTKYGHGCWSAVPKHAGLQRCGKSCRLRWINYLRPGLKRGAFSLQEENLIIEAHALIGNRWSQIASQLPGRTDNEIKNFWNSYLKKKLKQMGIDPNTHQALGDQNNRKRGSELENQITSCVSEVQPKFLSEKDILELESTLMESNGSFHAVPMEEEKSSSTERWMHTAIQVNGLNEVAASECLNSNNSYPKVLFSEWLLQSSTQLEKMGTAVYESNSSKIQDAGAPDSEYCCPSAVLKSDFIVVPNPCNTNQLQGFTSYEFDHSQYEIASEDHTMVLPKLMLPVAVNSFATDDFISSEFTFENIPGSASQNQRLVADGSICTEGSSNGSLLSNKSISGDDLYSTSSVNTRTDGINSVEYWDNGVGYGNISYTKIKETQGRYAFANDHYLDVGFL
eukprot:Gb_26833 [translate_table: standard]